MTNQRAIDILQAKRDSFSHTELDYDRQELVDAYDYAIKRLKEIEEYEGQYNQTIRFPIENDEAVGDLNYALINQLSAAQFILLYQLMTDDIGLTHETHNCINCGADCHDKVDSIWAYDCPSWRNKNERK